MRRTALALFVLSNSTACQNYVNSRYSHVFIDEYQDSGVEQHELFLKLNDLGLVSVAVGDADQSIFEFSGEDSKHLLDLAKVDDFKLFPVSINHRCHPSIVNYSLRLLRRDASLLECEDCRVFFKSINGNQESIAAWIDSCIERVREEYTIERDCEIGILVRGDISGPVIDSALESKHRYFERHSLEKHFSLWAKLFCQLMTYRFDESVTGQEIVDESSAILSRGEVKDVKAIIRQLRRARPI